MAWAPLFLRLSWPLPRGAALLGQCVMNRCLNESRCGDTIRQGSSSLDPKSPHPSAALFPTLTMTMSRARQAPAPAPLCPRPRTWLHRARRALLVPGSLLVSALCTHTGTQTQTPTPPPHSHTITHTHIHTRPSTQAQITLPGRAEPARGSVLLKLGCAHPAAPRVALHATPEPPQGPATLLMGVTQPDLYIPREGAVAAKDPF